MFRQDMCRIAGLVFLKNWLGIVYRALSSSDLSNCVLEFSEQQRVQAGRVVRTYLSSNDAYETLTTMAATPSLPPR